MPESKIGKALGGSLEPLTAGTASAEPVEQNKAEVLAMKQFMRAETAEAKAVALKDFMEACGVY